MPRSMASAAISFMSPPPWPRRTTSFSRVSVSKRSPPTGRATTRWKLLVPMSSAASTAVGPAAAVTVSVADPGDAGVEALRAHLRGSWRSSRSRCRGRRRSSDSSPTTSAVWIASSRSPGSITAASRGVVPVASGMMSATQLPVRQSSSEAAVLAGERAAERLLGGLAPGAAEHVADDEVAEAVVEVAGQRLVEEHLLVAGQYTAPVAKSPAGSSHVDLVGRRDRARRVRVGSVGADRPPAPPASRR